MVLPRLYAILDIDVAASHGLEPLGLLAGWLDAGVRLVQLRAKSLASGPLLDMADRMLRLTQAAGARLIINDRADVAAMAGADGVHVGQGDLSPRAVRAIVGDAAWVGLSTHSDEQLRRGCLEPVTHLAIGPVFSTATKPGGAAVVGLVGVSQAAARAQARGLPLVAIGGVTLATARPVLDAGASSVAVIADLLIGDPSKRARAFLAAVGTGLAGAGGPAPAP